MRNVLIVEDYEDTRFMMKFMIEGFGYRVTEAADGVEAVESVERSAPDLILMDVAMPGMNGLDATKAIRKFPYAAKIPIICVTAHGQAYREAALEAGCDELISKPLDFDAFETVVRRYLE